MGLLFKGHPLNEDTPVIMDTIMIVSIVSTLRASTVQVPLELCCTRYVTVHMCTCTGLVITLFVYTGT